jgi:tetratricopeptide (TPR) repeat protein
MPRISLRAYEKQIEELIEQNRLQEAVDHCRNILMTYPKCISTYRILGKSLLEGKQFEEGEDIFNRVLAVFPDDFIAHVGMSMVKENANDLNAAIWHMELAFDNQPSNISIQEELKRLFGRRDGNHPAKIRLTRGALVRMYARGELFPQAIAEINSALQEDAKRIDLKVLLAKMYFLMGDSTESLNLCNELIIELPYCYEINKILVTLLPSTKDAEKTPVYLDRLKALNPYEAFVGEKYTSDTDVPDDQVMLDQLVIDNVSNTHENAGWVKAMGSNWEDLSPASSTEWLPKTDTNINLPVEKAETPAESPLPEASEEASTASSNIAADTGDDNLPDWMRYAGWVPTDENSQPSEPVQNEPEPKISTEAADLPDWLHSLSPEISNADQISSAPDISQGTPTTSQPLNDAVEETVKPEQTEAAAENDLPDWLHSLTPEISDADQISSAPDISQGTPTTSQPLNDAAEETVKPEQTEAAAEDDLPDWLKNFEVESASEANAKDDLPDWMKSISSLDQPASDEVSKPEPIFKEPEPEPALDNSSPVTTNETPKTDDSQPASINPATHVLNPDTLGEELTNNTILPDLHALPENWQSNLADEEADKEKPALEKDADVPAWVRSIIEKEPTPVAEETTDTDSAKIEPESVTVPIDSTEPEPTAETGTAAISEKSGEDLLSWLRDLKPVENPDLTNPNEDETPNTENAVEAPVIDEASPLDRLDQLTSEEPVTAADNLPPLPETKPIGETAPIVPDDSGVILTPEEPIKPEIAETVPESANVGSLEHVPLIENQPIAEPDHAIEPPQTLPIPAEAAIPPVMDDFSNQLMSLNQQIITGDSMYTAIEELTKLSISNPDDYLVWQLLGDAYAKADKFTSALSSYNKAEELILKPL